MRLRPSHTLVVQNDWSLWAAISFFIALAILVSCFSGYLAEPYPPEMLWPFSPLGLIFSFPLEYWTYPTSGSFAGAFSFSLDYFFVFAKTCALEAAFYFWVFRGAGSLRTFAVLLLANLLTHPMVFFGFSYLIGRYLPSLLAAEAFAFSAEIALSLFLVKKWNLKVSAPWCAGAILLANLFSWQVGILLFF